ncbi:MAG: adenylate kinase [Ignavibacteria bacterium]|jgi:adenylate kinase
MQILIFGPPGVGKGTQAKVISQKYNISHISTGDILRKAVREGTELGLKAKEIMDRGDLVPDEVMGGLIKEVLKSDDCNHGFILDGFPRTVHQAEVLYEIFNELHFDEPCLIQLLIDDNTIINRLSNRRNCSNCHSIVNLNDLQDDSTCPVCGSKDTLVKRDDDDEKVIKKRLDVYKAQTSPVISFYKDKSKLVTIEADKKIEEVTAEIFEALKKC